MIPNAIKNDNSNQFSRHDSEFFESAGLLMPDEKTHSDHLRIQLAEIRQFNKRLEMVNFQLGEENLNLKAHVDELIRHLDGLRSFRYRVVDRFCNLMGRIPGMRYCFSILKLMLRLTYQIIRSGYRYLRQLFHVSHNKLFDPGQAARDIINEIPVFPAHLEKQEIVRYYAKKFDLKILVETGTYLGDMVQAMKSSFDRIYSIELDKDLFEKALIRFAFDSHVEILQGDSGIELGRLIPKLKQPTLFWLDGHYSGGITAKSFQDTPVMQELEHIFKESEFNHIVLIDDARLFGTDPAYPTISELTKYVLNIRPEVRIEVMRDCIRITPAK